MRPSTSAASPAPIEPLGDQLLGRSHRSDAPHLGSLEHSGRRLADPADCVQRTRPVVAVRFLGDVDDAAGVGQEVGDIQRAHRRQRLGHFGRRQLIVRPAHDDLEVEFCDDDPRVRIPPNPHGQRMSAGVPRASEGSTMRAAPARTASSTLSWSRSEAMTTASPLDEKSNDVPAHLARAEHEHRPSLEAGSPSAGRRRLHRHHHAQRSGGAGIAGSAAGRRRARHEWCRLLNQVHVILRRPDILGGDVAPVQAVDGGRKVTNEGRRLHDARVPDDDRLPTPVGQSGESRLCRHRSREAEDVVERECLVSVRIEPRTAERGAEESGMDGDDGAQTARRPAGEHDVLVLGPRRPSSISSGSERSRGGPSRSNSTGNRL